jgi:hypothetical protein
MSEGELMITSIRRPRRVVGVNLERAGSKNGVYNAMWKYSPLLESLAKEV